ncbi:hypothetical protein [Deinococcus altitudinis]|uniref:hypothetical protein n=1 Tax=Deinococcus altitudinis TaxID=468914 RepID=UPI003892942E
MRDPLDALLLSGAHHFLISVAWVLIFSALGFLMIRSLSLASDGNSPHHPLVWLVFAMLVWSVMLILWGTYRPEFIWGLLGLGIPAFGIVARIFRPRPRRFKSWS